LRILSYFEDNKQGTYYKYLLESTFSCEVVIVFSFDKFLDLITSTNDFSYCLASFTNKLGDLQIAVLEEITLSLPALFLLADNNQLLRILKIWELNSRNKNVHLMQITPDPQDILEHICNALEIQNNFKTLNDEFIPVHVNCVYKISKLNCDLYIKLSEKKFLKFFLADTELTAPDLARIQEKKADFLYVKSSDLDSFIQSMDSFLNENNEKYEKNELEIEFVDKAEDLLVAHEMFALLVNKLGINDRSLKYVNRAMNIFYSSLDDSPELQEICLNLVKKKDFVSEHSLVLAYLSNAILSCTDYYNDNNSIKLTLASMVHDLGLSDINYLKLEQGLVDREEFSKKDLKKFENHVTAPLASLRKIEGCPADIDSIIINHHERYDGTGFPRGLENTYIPFLATLFIIAHEITIEIFKTDFSRNKIDEFLSQREKEYQRGNFDVVIKVVKNVFNEAKV